MNKNILKENLVYLSLWVFLFLSAVISVYVRCSNDSSLSFNWNEVFMMWRTFIPFLAVFLIHNYIIAPLLVYKKKGWLYLALAFVMTSVFLLYTCQTKPEMRELPHRDNPAGMMDMRRDSPPPKPEGDKKPGGDFHDDGFQPGQPPHDFDGHGPMHQLREKEGLPPWFMGQREMLSFIVLVLMLGMNLGVKQHFKSSADAKAMEELERQNLKQQLEYLKYQINPHFFMNTLNNIHALVDIDSEEAKKTILELSKMMRYVLYEGAKSRVPLTRDIDFLHHYIALMRLRYTDKVRISVDIQSDMPDRMIPPMLFITYVENAFKHGVSYRKDSFIEIALKMKDDRLSFECRNSKIEQDHEEHGGVGLKNTQKRLELIYGSDYHLDIQDKGDTYEVRLEIPAEQEEVSKIE